MPKPIDFDVKITQHPVEGLSVTFVFPRKIRTFGLNADKAAILGEHLLKMVAQIRKAEAG